MKPVLIDLITSKKFIAAVAAILVSIAGKAGLDVDPALIEKIYIALLVYVGAQGIADVGKPAAQVKAISDQATSGTAEARIAVQRMAMRVPTSLLALGIGLAMIQVSCTAQTARPPLAAGAVALLDCESTHVDADMLADARLFADAKAASWIAGDARPDSTRIRADLRLIRSDLGRCAIAGALAALARLTEGATDPTTDLTTVARSADPILATSRAGELRTTFVDAARELGWPRVKTRDGAIL